MPCLLTPSERCSLLHRLSLGTASYYTSSRLLTTSANHHCRLRYSGYCLLWAYRRMRKPTSIQELLTNLLHLFPVFQILVGPTTMLVTCSSWPLAQGLHHLQDLMYIRVSTGARLHSFFASALAMRGPVVGCATLGWYHSEKTVS